MSDMFDYEKAEKHRDDVYTVMGSAIKKYFDDDESKITSALARTISKIIDLGFLDSVLKEQNELVKFEQKRAEKMRANANHEVFNYNYQHMQRVSLERQIEELQRQLKEIKQALNGELVGDSDLENAKKAYLWIKSETNDKILASKAFDSYLIGKNERDRQRVKERFAQKLDELSDEIMEDDGWELIE